MKLIGMLDSPFVRRAAISLECLGIPFEHEAISVFKTFVEFQQINPVVKAPTLILDDGTLLMDSNLIIQFAESISQKSLMPNEINKKIMSFRILGLCLAASEKAVQMIYEKNLRPTELHFEPWLKRVEGQLIAALTGVENELKKTPSCFTDGLLTQATITAAVTWQFINNMLPQLIQAQDYPLLAAHSEKTETLPEFLKYPPIGPGVIASN